MGQDTEKTERGILYNYITVCSQICAYLAETIAMGVQLKYMYIGIESFPIMYNPYISLYTLPTDSMLYQYTQSTHT